MFQIVKAIQRMLQPASENSDLQARPIEGTIYNNDLVKVIVSPQTEFQIDKIVRTRNKSGSKQHLVKWKGYDDCFNSWENSSDIKIYIMEYFYGTFPSDSTGYYFPSNTIANFKTKLTTPTEFEPKKRKVRLVDIYYPKGYKKLFLLNTLRLESAEISFPVKHYESVYDLTNFWEPYKKEKFIITFSEYINNYESLEKSSMV